MHLSFSSSDCNSLTVLCECVLSLQVELHFGNEDKASKDKDNHQSEDEKPRQNSQSKMIFEFYLEINFPQKSQILSACLKSNSIWSLSKYLGPEQCKKLSANV